MGQTTEELTTGIAGTREDLSRNFEALGERMSPGRVMERRRQALRGRIGSMRERIMGSSEDATGTAQEAEQTVRHRAEGNPLAAGLIAFGTGVLISSVIPSSEKESQAAQRVVETAKERGQPFVEEAKSVGQEMGQELKEQATEAAQEVKSSAQESAQQVKEEGRSSGEAVRDDAQSRMR